VFGLISCFRTLMPANKGISLKPVRFEDAMKALLQTPPMPRQKKTKARAKRPGLKKK
jgi:hypothetical protein